MNSRERILQTFGFVEPDRVPIDLGGHRASGIAAIAYAKLRDYLGLPKRPIRLLDTVLNLAIIDEDVLERFGVDVTELGRGFCQDEADWQPWRLPDGTECWVPHWVRLRQEGDTWLLLATDGTPIGLQQKGMYFFEQLVYPLQSNPEPWLDRLEEALAHDMWSAIAIPPGPVPMTDEGARFLADGARRFRAQTSRAIVAHVRGPLLEGGQHLFGVADFLVLLAAQPDLAHRFLDRLTALYIKRLDWFLGAVGPYIDVVIFFDDFGMQTGLQISPRMYREFFKPRQKQLWERVKTLAPHVKVLLHSCGSMATLLPDMLEVGLDAWNPVQISAQHMEPERLKREYGRRLVLWGGGCDTQQVLRAGTPAEIRAHVLRNLEVFAPGGGYVFTQVHNIMADVPPENIVAVFDAALEFNGQRR